MFESLVVRSRLMALLAAAALALGAAACGSEDDDGGGSGDAAAQDGGGSDGNPKQQVIAAYDSYVEDLYRSRWQKTCDAYSDAYAKAYPKQVKIAKTCPETLRKMFPNIGAQARPWMKKVEIEDANTAVGVSMLREGQPGVRIRFVREGGEWKLDGPADAPPKAGKGS